MKTDESIRYDQQFLSDEIASSYDLDGYVPGTYSSLLYTLEKEELRACVSEMKAAKGGLDLLDFACGTGRISSALESSVDTVVGIDISPHMLKRARAKMPNARLECGDLTTETGLCRGPFDLIVAFRFVTNAEPSLREAALKQLRLRLRDRDSRLVFNVHRNLNSYLILHWLYYKVFPSASKRWHYMSIREAMRLARHAGLNVERAVGLGFLSSHVASRMPSSMALRVERLLSKMPLLSLLGSEVILVCTSAES